MKNEFKTPFDYLINYSNEKILQVLNQEEAETIAIVLCYMDSGRAAGIMQNLNPSIHANIIKNISLMDKTPSQTINNVEKEMEEKLSQSLYKLPNGNDLAIKILNKTASRNTKKILDELNEENSNVFEQIKTGVFVFENIVKLDDRHIQKVLREVDAMDLATALKTANTGIQDKIFINMPRRAAAMIREDMEYLGPVILKDVEEAQEKIIRIINDLESKGEIIIQKQGENIVIDGEISRNKVEHLTSLSDILDTSDSFIKKLISMLGVRFLASVFHEDEEKTEIYNTLYKNMGIFRKKSFKKYWNAKEPFFNNKEGKELILSMIRAERLINISKNKVIEYQLKA